MTRLINEYYERKTTRKMPEYDEDVNFEVTVQTCKIPLGEKLNAVETPFEYLDLDASLMDLLFIRRICAEAAKR
ncbi:hypothetical protein TNCV_3288471 [Trichonephila clavipes]|nr:hypothetical protein TNCV_3288471 [Trichonephila clavipes]